MDGDPRITIDPARRGGEPCIRNLDISVHEVLSCLARLKVESAVLAEFPVLELADVHACLAFARRVAGAGDDPVPPVSNTTRADGLAERAEARRSRIVGHRARSHEEAEAWDLEYWQSRTPAERLAALAAIHADVEKVRRRDG